MARNDPDRKKAFRGERLRAERIKRDWSQKEVADKIGVPDPHTVGRWERGVQSPSLFYRKKLTELFGKSLEEPGLLAAPTARSSGFSTVPAVFTSLIGRKQAVNEVSVLLLRPDVRLLTLLGVGGIGKTRLAIAVAEQVQERFADGVCFVSLAALSDPISVIPAIANALGIEGKAPLLPEQQIKHVLQDKELLLFLDNFEHVMSVAPFIENVLQECPRIKVLVTSRQVLDLQAEQQYNVPPLTLPDLKHLPVSGDMMHYPAIALFMQHAQMHLPSFALTEENAVTIAELCIHLDGLPLAIVLAAARIKLLQPQSLLARPPQDLLHILKSSLHNVPERHLSLNATIEWSYNLLDEQEQWLFRHLSVFVGGVTLPTVETFFSATFRPSAVMEIVGSLLSKSLLQRVEPDGEEPRFMMLETLRSFAGAWLQRNGELEEHQRTFAVYVLSVVEEAAPHLKKPEQAVWLEKLRRELDNIRAALQWLIGQKETALALRFCEAFGKFCGLGGYWHEERLWLEAALALPLAEHQPIYCKVLRRAGHLAYRFRNLSQARELLERSVFYSRQQQDWSNLAGALSSLAWVMYRQGIMQQVGVLLLESVERARQSGDAWSLANALESQGRYMHAQGNIDEASHYLLESITIARVQLDPECIARILTSIVKLELTRGNTESAMLLAQESFQVAQALHTSPLIALALDTLGEVALSRGARAEAKRYFEERLVLAEELGDTSSIERTKRLLEQALDA